jgi:DNA-binding transcriptional LysR family regulator
MELHQVRDFVVVAEELNLTRAAAKLHIAQPSLSRKIKVLEHEIGVPLFERKKRPFTLTEAGHTFLEEAKRILALSTESIELARRASRSGVERLRIGYIAGLEYHRLPATLAAFHRVCPSAQLRLFDMSCAEQLRTLNEGHLDLGFLGVSDALADTGLRGECIARYQLLAAIPETHPLARKIAISLKDFEATLFIGLSRAAYPRHDVWMRRVLQPLGFRPRMVEAAESMSAILALVAAGFGIGLVHETGSQRPPAGVIFRPLKPPLEGELYVGWHPDNRSKCLQEYLTILRGVPNTAQELVCT